MSDNQAPGYTVYRHGEGTGLGVDVENRASLGGQSSEP